LARQQQEHSHNFSIRAKATKEKEKFDQAVDHRLAQDGAAESVAAAAAVFVGIAS
jgi:hypothetical protein